MQNREEIFVERKKNIEFGSRLEMREYDEDDRERICLSRDFWWFAWQSVIMVIIELCEVGRGGS